MSNAVFLRPDENGSWGRIGTDITGNQSTLLTLQNAATALGTGTVIDPTGYSTILLDVVISATATVLFEGSTDGVTFTTLYPTLASLNVQSTGSVATTQRGLRVNVGGYKYFQARISSYTSGTVTVTGYLTTAPIQQNFLTAGAGDGVGAALLASGGYVYDAGSAVWNRARSASQAADASGGTNYGATSLMVFNGTNWDRVRSAGAGDGIVSTGVQIAGLYHFDSTSGTWIRSRSAGAGDGVGGSNILSNGMYGFAGSLYDRIRTGKVYKYIEYLNLPTSTSTTVWTPAAGKKFRLMGVSISSSASIHLHLRDATTIFHTVRPLATSVTFDFGNGYLSAAANNVLEIRNDSGTTSNVWVTAWGTEE